MCMDEVGGEHLCCCGEILTVSSGAKALQEKTEKMNMDFALS